LLWYVVCLRVATYTPAAGTPMFMYVYVYVYLGMRAWRVYMYTCDCVFMYEGMARIGKVATIGGMARRERGSCRVRCHDLILQAEETLEKARERERSTRRGGHAEVVAQRWSRAGGHAEVPCVAYV